MCFVVEPLCELFFGICQQFFSKLLQLYSAIVIVPKFHMLMGGGGGLEFF